MPTPLHVQEKQPLWEKYEKKVKVEESMKQKVILVHNKKFDIIFDFCSRLGRIV